MTAGSGHRPASTQALIGFIAGRPVSCKQVDYDRTNKRPVVLCYAGRDDIQALMVNAGWAWAYAEFSDKYVADERYAIAQRLGVHAHRCEKPSVWRARQSVEREVGR